MGQYTILENPEADVTVQKALNLVVRNVLELMGENLDAILLIGGFGRGEGGVVKENGRFRPVNDFDMAVLVAKAYRRIHRQYTRQLQELCADLAPLCGVKQIDIGISHPLRFRFAPNLVESYEVRNGYKVLWGDIDLEALMPDLPADRLPLLDGAIYFLSRGSGMLIPALYFLLDGKGESGKVEKILPRHRENFQIEVNKGCLAMGNALLLLRKQYHFSYRERRRRMQQMEMNDVPDGEMVRSWYVEAVQQKLLPRFDWPGDAKMIERWFCVRDVFARFFLWFEGVRLGREFQNWEAYSSFVSSQVRDPFAARLRVSLRVIMKKGIRSIYGSEGRQARLQMSQSYKRSVMPTILFSLERDGVNKTLLNSGRALLELPKTEDGVACWGETARCYLSMFHPGGVVAELLGDQ